MYDEHNNESKAQNNETSGSRNTNEAYHWNTPAPESGAYHSGAGTRETFPQNGPQQPSQDTQNTQQAQYVHADPMHTPEHGTPLYEREHKRFGSGFHGGSGCGAKKTVQARS